MARRQNNRPLRQGKYVIVGAGLTERYYFTHLKRLISLPVDIRPRMFGRENITALTKRIEEIVPNAIVLCVFDADVSQWDAMEKQRLQDMKRQYRNNDNVHLFDSMPSIEYWFLLHFENTNRFMATSHEAMNALRKHIPDFDKTTQFLEKDQWVRLLLADNRLATACERAETFSDNKTPDDTISYSELYKFFKLLTTNK